jgi:adhesin transport system membrane fusion protein
MARRRKNDSEFSDDLKIELTQGPRRSANIVLYAIVLFFIAAVVWAQRARIDEVTTGEGTVIPSGQVQIVQNLEGGIVSELLVREGDEVEEGQVLLRIDDTTAASNYRENQVRYLAQLAAVSRLSAEMGGSTPQYPEELDDYLDVTAREDALFTARQSELASALAILKELGDQRRQLIVELDSSVKKFNESLAFAKEELAITEPMVERGVTSRIELLRLRRQVADLEREREAARLGRPRAESGLVEIGRRIEEKIAGFRSIAQTELNEANVRLQILRELATTVEDRVARSEVRSPVHGIVKALKINTVGGVIQPGMDLAEVVPLEDNLLVEARIKPQDIAFLFAGQDARVKITAYDFGFYGSLAGTLEQISADAIVDDKGQSFFRIRVRTENNSFTEAGEQLPIIPGMVAQVDIVTGERSVLQYFLKPVSRARDKALRER